MNTVYKAEKSLLAAVLAVLAVSAVFIGLAAIDSDAATATADDPYAGADLPQRSIDFDVTLGYEYYALSEQYPDDEFFNYCYPHSQYWVASFDFSDSIQEGRYWPYGNDAVIAVTFYFSDGSADDIGNIKASKTVCYPVFEVNGVPYVEDVICTPDLWPSEDNAYPVQVEAVIYTTLYNDSAANGQY